KGHAFMRIHAVPNAFAPCWVRRALASLSMVVLLLTACGSDNGTSDADGPDGGTATDTVTFALDWAPNTNHIGVYVAEELGYFDDVGLDVEILPYGTTSATELVSEGTADFGIGGQASVQMGRTAGLDIVSVYRVTQ